jgi:hypothetical protein
VNAGRIVSLLLEEPSKIMKDLVAGAVGFGSFMKSTTRSSHPGWSFALAKKWEYSRDWNHAGEVTIRVYDFGKSTTRPNSMTISMDWIGSIGVATVGVNLWDMTPDKKVNIVYILRDAVKVIEREADKMESEMQQVHTYNEDARMKGYMQEIFNHVKHQVTRVTDGE